MPRARQTQTLTVSYCTRAAYEGTGKSKDVRWDSKVPSLGLRLYPSGRKGWVVSYKTDDGRTRLYTLRGSFPGLTPDAARQAARDYLGQVARGADPLDEREQSRTERPTTLKDLIELYDKQHLKALVSGQQTRAALDRTVVPVFGRRQAESLTSREVTDWHLEVGRERGPAAAGKAWASLRALIGWAQEEGHVDQDWRPPNIARGKRLTSSSREVYVPEHVLPRVWPALERIACTRARGAATILMLVLLTGARPGEWRTARREWLDLDAGVLVIPPEHHKTGKKTKKPRRIPLCDEAVALLRAWPRRLGSPWLFAGQRPENHLSRSPVGDAWRRVRAELGIEHVTAYDLRRTAATMLLAAGVDHLTIARILGHKGLGQVQTYARVLARKEVEAVGVLGKLKRDAAS